MEWVGFGEGIKEEDSNGMIYGIPEQVGDGGLRKRNKMGKLSEEVGGLLLSGGMAWRVHIRVDVVRGGSGGSGGACVCGIRGAWSWQGNTGGGRGGFWDRGSGVGVSCISLFFRGFVRGCVWVRVCYAGDGEKARMVCVCLYFLFFPSST